MCTPSLYHTLLLLTLPGVGTATYWKLRHQFKSVNGIIAADSALLAAFLPSNAFEQFLQYRQYGDDSAIAKKMQNILERAQTLGVALIHVDNKLYPEQLGEITNPPPLLYVRGEPSLLSIPQVAIVGSRNPSPAGEKNAYAFAKHLCQNGVVITSGLAIGIDGCAHRGAVESEGLTIAVMGTGLDSIYPQRHQDLANSIVEKGGVLVSEFPFGTPPSPQNFPRRNRIISGLSYGVLVIEAKLKSGSLITARLAMEENREVFALPGSIHNIQSRGCHALIKEGATLVEQSQDIIDHLHGFLAKDWDRIKCIKTPSSNPISEGAFSDTTQQILEAIGFDAIPCDEIAMMLDMPSHDVSACLVELELDGIVSLSHSGYLRVR